MDVTPPAPPTDNPRCGCCGQPRIPFASSRCKALRWGVRICVRCDVGQNVRNGATIPEAAPPVLLAYLAQGYPEG